MMQAWQGQNQMRYATKPETQEELRFKFKISLLSEFFPAPERSVFVLLWPSPDWRRPTHITKDNILYQSPPI